MIAALVLWSVVELIAGVIGTVRSLIGRMAAGEPSSAGEVELLDEPDDLSSNLRLGVLTVAAVVSIVWLFPVRANAEGRSWHRHGRPWLVLAWVVPIVNLSVPRRLIDDIWLSSRPGPPPDGRRQAGRAPVVAGLLWWGGLLVYFVVIRATEGRLSWLLEEDALPWLARLEIMRTLVGIAASVLAALVLWRISSFQEPRRTAHIPADARPGALDAG
ncbi:hypothetical protein GCM10022226_32930 [Sphaerisporangium flaviroseum]|uniref:DUF4328 domain-containing protein n=1 Tax=Sphaerisporangium flaviroseum TaxID=509199 RepID=A0ABP7I453_9ACTN